MKGRFDMSDCLFCKIAEGQIPSNKVYEDEVCFAFYDIDPQAPTHFLVIPKMHIASVAEVSEDNAAVVAHIFAVISKVTKELGLELSLIHISYRWPRCCTPCSAGMWADGWAPNRRSQLRRVQKNHKVKNGIRIPDAIFLI